MDTVNYDINQIEEALRAMEDEDDEPSDHEFNIKNKNEKPSTVDFTLVDDDEILPEEVDGGGFVIGSDDDDYCYDTDERIEGENETGLFLKPCSPVVKKMKSNKDIVNGN